jgi:hypothetical protein
MREMTATLPPLRFHSSGSRGWCVLAEQAALGWRPREGKTRITGTIASDRHGNFEYEPAIQSTDCNGRACCLTQCIMQLALCAINGLSHSLVASLSKVLKQSFISFGWQNESALCERFS